MNCGPVTNTSDTTDNHEQFPSNGLGCGLYVNKGPVIGYANGEKKENCSWKNGSLRGKWTEWYASGQKRIEGKIKDGEAKGDWTEWFADGQKSVKGTRKKGPVKERWTLWHERVQRELSEAEE